MSAVDKYNIYNSAVLGLVMGSIIQRKLPSKPTAPSRSLVKYRKKRSRVNKIAAKSRKRNR